MAELLKDDVNTVQYGVMVNGKVLFTSSARYIAENYKNNLPEMDKSTATIIPLTTGGKQILFD